MEKGDFTFDEKMTIWLHYVVKQCYLNAWLKIECKSKLSEFPIRTFDDFTSDGNEISSSGIIGYYWRFKNEIFTNYETTKPSSS